MPAPLARLCALLLVRLVLSAADWASLTVADAVMGHSSYAQLAVELGAALELSPGMILVLPEAHSSCLRGLEHPVLDPNATTSLGSGTLSVDGNGSVISFALPVHHVVEAEELFWIDFGPLLNPWTRQEEESFGVLRVGGRDVAVSLPLYEPESVSSAAEADEFTALDLSADLVLEELESLVAASMHTTGSVRLGAGSQMRLTASSSGGCPQQLECSRDADCPLQVCSSSSSTCSTCFDGALSPEFETCVDGGGVCGALCALGDACDSDDDCLSYVCGDGSSCAESHRQPPVLTTTPALQSLGGVYSSAVVADLSGDALPDLLVFDGQQFTHFVASSGDFSFEAHELDNNHGLDAEGAHWFSCGDIDADGDVDCHTATSTTSTLWENIGTLTEPLFAAVDPPQPLADLSFVQWDLGDVDKDGNDDLLVAHRDGAQWHAGDGAGGYSATGTPVLDEADSYSRCALCDMDLDSDLDVVCSAIEATELRLLLNVDSGVFLSSSVAWPTWNVTVGTYSDVACADTLGRGIYLLVASSGLQLVTDGDGCANGFQDGDETGVDCGGPICEACSSVSVTIRGPSAVFTDRTTSFVLEAVVVFPSLSSSSFVSTLDWSGPDEFSLEPSADGAAYVTVSVLAPMDPSVDHYLFSVTVTDDVGTSNSSSLALRPLFYPEATLTGPAVTATIADGGFAVSTSVDTSTGTSTSGSGTIDYELADVGANGAVYLELDRGTSPFFRVPAGVYSVVATVTSSDGLSSQSNVVEVVFWGHPQLSMEDAVGTLPSTAVDAEMSVPVSVNAVDVADAAYSYEWVGATPTANASSAVVTAGAGTHSVGVTVTCVDSGMSQWAQAVVTVLEMTASMVTVVIDGVSVVPLGTEFVSLSAEESWTSFAAFSALEFEWQLTASPPATDAALANADSSTVTLTGLDVAGTYSVLLTATDANGASGSQTAEVYVNSPPVIVLPDGGDFFWVSQGSVTFNASESYDPELADQDLEFSWQLGSSCGGMGLSFAYNASVATLSNVGDPGLCLVELQVTDGFATTAETVGLQVTSLAVTTPSLQSEWFEGSSYSIAWAADGFSADGVEVWLAVTGFATSFRLLGAGSAFDADGSYEFTVPIDFSGTLFDSTVQVSMTAIDTKYNTHDAVTETAVSGYFQVRPSHEWTTGVWGNCSAVCATGEQTRSVACLEHGSELVDDYFCSLYSSKPSTSIVCFAGACEDYSWREGEWSEACVATSDCATTGTRSRDVECVSSANAVVADALCEDDKPSTSHQCAASACESWEWAVVATGPCSSDGAQPLLYGCRNTLTGRQAPPAKCDGLEVPGEDTATCTPEEDEEKAWSECSASCGSSGTKTRGTTEAPCNRFPCSGEYYSYVVGDFGDACSRSVRCRSSGTPNVLDDDVSACEAALGTAPQSTRDCNQGLSFCDTTACSGRGSCDEESESCQCEDGFAGAFCEALESMEVADAQGNACDGAVEPASGECCALPAVLDGSGTCCTAGALDDCGSCCSDSACPKADIYGSCCLSMALDASGICCVGELDACGVCAGDGSTCSLVVAATSSSSSNDCSGEAARDLDRIAAWLSLPKSRVSVGNVECSSSEDRRLSLSASSAEYTISPPIELFEAAALLALAQEEEEEQDFAVTSLVTAGVCGNGVCEGGEQCEADGSNAAECCSTDCPVVALACTCSGHGTCVAASGACACFEAQGYAGDACDECVPGFYETDDGGCAVEVVSLGSSGSSGSGSSAAAPQTTRSTSDGVDDAVIVANVAATGVLLLVAVVAAAVLFVRFRSARRLSRTRSAKHITVWDFASLPVLGIDDTAVVSVVPLLRAASGAPSGSPVVIVCQSMAPSLLGALRTVGATVVQGSFAAVAVARAGEANSPVVITLVSNDADSTAHLLNELGHSVVVVSDARPSSGSCVSWVAWNSINSSAVPPPGESAGPSIELTRAPKLASVMPSP